MKSYLYLVIAFIVLLVVALLLYFKNSSGSINAMEKDFSIENIDEIDKIAIRSDTLSILLEKEGKNWRLNSTFRAKQEVVKLMLFSLQRIEVISPVPRDYQSIAVKKLENFGTSVKVFEGNRLIRAFYIMHDTSEVKGNIILNQNAHIPFLVKLKGLPTGDISLIFSTDLSFLKDNTLFSYLPDDIASVSIKYPPGKLHSFKIIYQGENLPELIDLESGKRKDDVDFKMANDYRYYFSNVKYYPTENSNRNVPSKKQFLARIEIQDKKGKEITVELFKKQKITDDNKSLSFDLNYCYGYINNEKKVVLLKYLDFDPILREIDDFLKK